MKEIKPGAEEAGIPTVAIGFPYDVTFADSATYPAAVARIEDHLFKLNRFYSRIIDCKVFVRIPHKHAAARQFHIHIQLDVPGKRLAVSRFTEMDDSHMDLRLALKDAFDKITRQLEDFVSLRKEHKPH